jgi:hypothetical protein
LLFYLELGGFFDSSVLLDVPIAGREDTERDGNSCFKIQRVGVVASLLIPSRERIKKRQWAPLGVKRKGSFCSQLDDLRGAQKR